MGIEIRCLLEGGETALLWFLQTIAPMDILIGRKIIPTMEGIESKEQKQLAQKQKE